MQKVYQKRPEVHRRSGYTGAQVLVVVAGRRSDEAALIPWVYYFCVSAAAGQELAVSELGKTHASARSSAERSTVWNPPLSRSSHSLHKGIGNRCSLNA